MKRISISGQRRGFALVLVMAQITLLMTFWSIANRQTGQLLKLESATSTRVRRDQGSLSALAVGLGLLETGFPPTSPYTGAITMPTLFGDLSYLVTFTDQGEGAWKIEVAPAPPDDLTLSLPTSFEAPN